MLIYYFINFQTRKFWNSYPLPENMIANPEMFQNIVDEMARREKSGGKTSDNIEQTRDEL